jgi:hypothetical protein
MNPVSNYMGGSLEVITIGNEYFVAHCKGLPYHNLGEHFVVTNFETGAIIGTAVVRGIRDLQKKTTGVLVDSRVEVIHFK